MTDPLILRELERLRKFEPHKCGNCTHVWRGPKEICPCCGYDFKTMTAPEKPVYVAKTKKPWEEE